MENFGKIVIIIDIIRNGFFSQFVYIESRSSDKNTHSAEKWKFNNITFMTRFRQTTLKERASKSLLTRRKRYVYSAICRQKPLTFWHGHFYPLVSCHISL